MRGVVAVLVLVALLAGCLSSAKPAGQVDQGGREGRAPTSPGNVTTVKREATWTAGVAAAGQAHEFAGSGIPLEDVAAENLTGVIVEMHWTPATPLSQRMSLHVWTPNGPDLGMVAGTSPLRLVFPGTAAAGQLVLDGHPDDPGVQVAQGSTFYLTAFRGVPFDPAYSAIAH